MSTPPTEFFGIPIVDVPATVDTPSAVVRFLATWLEAKGSLPTNELDRIVKATMKRESLGSTGIGKGFAIPHTTSNAIEKSAFVVGRLAVPVEWDAIDGVPVQFVAFMVTQGSDRAASLRELEKLVRRIREGIDRDDEPE